MSRIARADDTRAASTRRKVYVPPSALDAPRPRSSDVKYRWVRASVGNDPDSKNIGKRSVEGYEPVRGEDHPEYKGPVHQSGAYAGAIGVGDLVLMKNAVENVEAREEYYRDTTARQIQAIDEDMLREQHPASPFQVERKSMTGVRMRPSPDFRD